MHIFRAFVALCIFSEGEKEFLASHAYTHIHTRMYTHLITPYSPPLFLPKVSAGCFGFFANKF